MRRAVIITRTAPGCFATADRVREIGHEPVLSTMLTYDYSPLSPSAFGRAAHLVFTSANGVRALEGLAPLPDVTAWCVGPDTARAAREAGFTDVEEGPGNADDLAGMILSRGPAPGGEFLHIANADAAGELVRKLTEGGLAARFQAAYTTHAARTLSPQAAGALQGAAPVILLVHSAKAARAVAETGADLSRAALVAISPAAAQPLTGKAGHGDWIAARPNEEALLAALSLAAEALPA